MLQVIVIGDSAMQHEAKRKQEVEAAKNLILETLDGDSILEFECFKDFYGWLDTALHYDQHLSLIHI